MSPSMAGPVIVLHDQHPQAPRRRGGLAIWLMGKSPTWLMAPAAACRILESKEGLGNSERVGWAHFLRSGGCTPHEYDFMGRPIDLCQGGILL